MLSGFREMLKRYNAVTSCFSPVSPVSCSPQSSRCCPSFHLLERTLANEAICDVWCAPPLIHCGRMHGEETGTTADAAERPAKSDAISTWRGERGGGRAVGYPEELEHDASPPDARGNL